MSYKSQHQFKNATPIALSTDVAAETSRLIGMLRGNSRRTTKPISDHARNRADLALYLYGIRRERAHLFDGDLFGEAAWDILLILYRAEVEQLRLTVSNVCDAAGVPATTALRWIGKLERDGLIQRAAHPSDGRVFRLTLTESACQKMNDLLDRALAMNLTARGTSAITFG